MSNITFEVDSSNANPRTGEGYMTIIYKHTEGKLIPAGYCGNDYIRKGGYIPSTKEVLGTVKGILSYADEREWIELLS